MDRPKQTGAEPMTIAQFEEAVQGRVVEVKNTLQLNALLFATEYTPENFAKKMNFPANSSQPIDKLKKGLETYEYFCNTYTGGYIHCVVSNQQTATGGGISMNPVQEYFTQHATQLWLVKHGVKILGSAAVLLVVTFVATHPDALPYGALILWAANEAKKWLDNYDADKPGSLPGVGAGGKKE